MLLAAALLWVQGLTAAVPPAGGPPIAGARARKLDVGAYRLLLQRWEMAVASLRSAAAARHLAGQAPAAWRVELQPAQPGHVAPALMVPAGWLRQGLEAMARGGPAFGSQRQNLLRQLRQRAALAAAPLPPAVLAARRQSLAAILAQPVFAARPRRTMAQAMQRQLAEWLAAAGHWLFGRISPGQGSGWALLALLLAGAAAAMVWAVRRWWRGRRRPVAAAPASGPNDARAWLHRARQAAAAGHEGAAASHAYYAGLLFGAEAGWWRLRQAGTPREYLRLLPQGHPAHAGWSALTAAFEGWRYARRAGAAETAQLILRGLEGLGCR